MMYLQFVPLMASLTNFSDSLEAVPFPIAMISILYLSISSKSFLVAPALSFTGS